VSEPTSEQSARSKRPDFVRAFVSSVRQAREKRSLPGLVVTGALTVVLAGALAVGIGALVLHKEPPKTVNAADAQRSPSASRSPLPKAIPPRPVIPGAPVAGAPGSAHNPAKAGRSPGAAKAGHGGTAVSGTGSGTAFGPGSGGTGGSVSVRSAPATGNTIVSNASGRCIDISGNGSNGATLQIWSCTRASWQLWSFQSGTFRSGNLCMTASGSSNGTRVSASSCNGSSSQLFRLTDANDIVHSGTSACVDVKDQKTSNGTSLQLWKCSGTSNQKWHTA
jgi:Ricin-type beta-trefoil lectin domain